MSKTLATSHFMKSKPVEAARRDLYNQGIKTSYNEDVMIFSALHTAKNSMNNRYLQECNGLILEQKTWRPLVVPPRSVRFNIDTEASNRFLHQGLYHIYEVEDGTCFNLYFYDGEWVISTARGYNMNDVKWNNSATYKEIIGECLANLGLTWDTFTAALNTKNCYSFGFKHPLMQKFREGKANPILKLWFIQSVCTEEGNPRYLWSSDASPLDVIPNQKTHDHAIGDLRKLYKQAASALTDFIESKEVCYGYILRSVNTEVTKDHSDLFIESSLMRAIRQTWYENGLIDACHANNWNKELAITLNAYLSSESIEVFNTLFPEYALEMQVYSAFTHNTASDMASKNVDNDLAMAFLQMFNDDVKYDTDTLSLEEKTNLYFEYLCHPESLDHILNNASNELLEKIKESRDLLQAVADIEAPTANTETSGSNTAAAAEAL